MSESALESGSAAGPSAEDFAATMPGDYAQLYARDEIAEHAAIVARRRLEPAHAEVWRPLPAGGAVLCIVADDHPGFLSTVSAVLYLHELDVVTAKSTAVSARTA